MGLKVQGGCGMDSLSIGFLLFFKNSYSTVFKIKNSLCNRFLSNNQRRPNLFLKGMRVLGNNVNAMYRSCTAESMMTQCIITASTLQIERVCLCWCVHARVCMCVWLGARQIPSKSSDRCLLYITFAYHLLKKNA